MCSNFTSYVFNVRRTGTIFSDVKNRYQVLTSWKNGIKSSHMKNWYQNSHVRRAGTKFSTMWKIGTKLSQIGRTGTLSSQMSVSVNNWNRMQNAADWGGGGGVFYQCEEYACMLYEI